MEEFKKIIDKRHCILYDKFICSYLNAMIFAKKMDIDTISKEVEDESKFSISIKGHTLSGRGINNLKVYYDKDAGIILSSYIRNIYMLNYIHHMSLKRLNWKILVGIDSM